MCIYSLLGLHSTPNMVNILVCTYWCQSAFDIYAVRQDPLMPICPIWCARSAYSIDGP